MGYRISSLASLPVLPGKNVYVFALGQRAWDGGLLAQLEANFAQLAKDLGPGAAMIRPHEGTSLALDLVEASSNGPAGLRSLLLEAESGEGSILVLGAHPKELQPDDLVLFSTLRDLEARFGSLAAFFTALCQFARDQDERFLAKFEERSDIVDHALDVIELKPNFFGIGLNINNAIERLRRRLSR